MHIANRASYQSRKVAKSIHSSFVRAGIRSRGIEGNDFRVLNNHSRPAVLVECGYVTNMADAKKLNNRWYRAKIAEAISDGIIAALGRSY